MSKVQIYKLVDPRTDEPRYAGKTKNRLSKRVWEHIKGAKQKKKSGEKLNHKENWIMQLDSLGLKPRIELIELVEESLWKEKEIYYIAEYRKLYNMTNVHDGGDDNNPVNKRPVAKIDFITLEVVRKYESLHEAEREEGIPYSRIVDACSGRKMRVSGYLWNYLDENGNTIRPEYKYNKRKIGKFNLKKELISIHEDGSALPLNVEHCCRGKVRCVKGHIWRKLDVWNNVIEPDIKYKKKTVSQLTSEGELIEVFENAAQAALANGYVDDHVRRSCKSGKLYHGFKWQYNDY